MGITSSNIPISAVIITLNEESNIVRCLNSLDFVDEVVIYDSGSKDRTIAVAQQMSLFTSGRVKLNIIQGEWLGFGPTKNKATSLTTHSWVLSIDADEVVSLELKQELQNLKNLNPESEKNSYLVPRRSFYLNRWIDHGGWSPDYQLRIFNKVYWQWDLAPIHEKVMAAKPNFKSEKLISPMNHFVFKNIEHQVQTNNRYSTLQAEKMLKEGKSFNWFHFLTKPHVKFIECFYWKLGFLDGWAGFVIAVSAGYSVFLKWAKLAELQKNQLAELQKNQLKELQNQKKRSE